MRNYHQISRLWTINICTVVVPSRLGDYSQSGTGNLPRSRAVAKTFGGTHHRANNACSLAPSTATRYAHEDTKSPRCLLGKSEGVASIGRN
jgi:hypothetical protein